MVNNDHFLYWGDVTKTSEDGIDFTFQVIEQTEFIEDLTFQPCKGNLIVYFLLILIFILFYSSKVFFDQIFILD